MHPAVDKAILPASDPRTERILRDYAILEGDAGAVRVRPALPDEFADVVKLAAILCETPLAFVTFVGDEIQWIGAREGADILSTPRSHSFCVHAMRGSDMMVVADAREDSRFAGNPYVTGEPHIRFYAGVPLISPEGIPLGALCVLDPAPRADLTEPQAFGLRTLTAQVMERLESQRRAAWRARVETTLLDLTSDTGFVRRLEWNVSADETIAPSDTFAGLRDAPAIRLFLGTIHDRDRDSVAHAIERSVRSGLDAPGGDLRIECRLRPDDSSVRSILVRGRVIGDVDRRFVGVVTDVTEQRKAERLSAESDSRFRVLADTMPQMVWSSRADGLCDYFNARWYEFTGLAEGSTDGEAWVAPLHPDDRERARTQWRRCLTTGEPYEIEYRLRHHDGRHRWVLGRALPVRNDHGEIVRWFGTCTDIHETKQAAEERELVAQELSHRIKNTFLVISGLIGLYARHDPAVRPFAREIRERVVALGRAHNFVRPQAHDSRPGGPVTLRGLMAELTEPYRLDGKERIRLTGDDLPIDDRAATPMALLLHELATNAVKYGALSVLGGVVDIDARVTDERLVLSWTEAGGPPPADAPRIEGFGTRVSRLSVEAQLGGSLRYDWQPTGLRVVADIPRGSLDRQPTRRNVFAQESGAFKGRVEPQNPEI